MNNERNITEHLPTHNILSYHRMIDDIHILTTDITSAKAIITHITQTDTDLKYTSNISNDSSIFLDLLLFKNKQNKLETCMYFKLHHRFLYPHPHTESVPVEERLDLLAVLVQILGHQLRGGVLHLGHRHGPAHHHRNLLSHLVRGGSVGRLLLLQQHAHITYVRTCVPLRGKNVHQRPQKTRKGTRSVESKKLTTPVWCSSRW